jgi:hypothetical protein
MRHIVESCENAGLPALEEDDFESAVREIDGEAQKKYGGHADPAEAYARWVEDHINRGGGWPFIF